MWDLIRLLAGPRVCPWCSDRGESLNDRITDRLPVSVIKVLLRYDAVIGRIGIPLHERLHEHGVPDA
ncbi:MAG TPA: hypothetical protein VFQ44_02290 [Streptosporangiaceae bacterium]|nr:hypothetical protein [Streptosporangiaceae bacterium]